MGGWPFEAVIAGLFVVVMARSHLFYWLGRGVFTGAARLVDRVPGAAADGAAGLRPADPAVTPAADALAAGGADPATGSPAPRRGTSRAHGERLLRTPTARRGLALVHRFGPFAVTFAYLTVGVQTAVFVGAGLVRMPYPRFLAASLPGSVAWAFVWGTVGLGAVWAAVRLATASPWGLAALLAAGAGVVAGLVVRRRRVRRAGSAVADDAATERTHEPV